MNAANRQVAWNWAAEVTRWAGDFLFPPLCLVCHHELPPGGETRVCSDCQAEILPKFRDWCPRCGAVSGPHLDLSEGCLHCREDRYAFSLAFALGIHEATLRRAILRAKHRDGLPMSTWLARQLWDLRGDALQQFSPEVVVPIPGWRWRDWWAAHHHAEAIARVLAKEMGCPIVRALVKPRRTAKQAALSGSERRRLRKDVFHPQLLRLWVGKRILLVDDVMTTGITLHRAAQVLVKNGAGPVAAAVIARGLG